MAFTPSYKNDKSNIVKGKISASIEVCLGDLLILENNLLVPANQIINQGSLLANREYAAARFAGVASQNSALNSEDDILLWSFGEFEMMTTTPGYVIGQKLTFADEGGGILSRNEVAFSTDDMLSIGIVLRSSGISELKTWFRLESRVFALALSGGSPAPPPPFDPFIDPSNLSKAGSFAAFVKYSIICGGIPAWNNGIRCASIVMASTFRSALLISRLAERLREYK